MNKRLWDTKRMSFIVFFSSSCSTLYIYVYAIPHILFTFLGGNVINIPFTGSSRESAMCDRHDEEILPLKPLVEACDLLGICSLLTSATELRASAMQVY